MMHCSPKNPSSIPESSSLFHHRESLVQTRENIHVRQAKNTTYSFWRFYVAHLVSLQENQMNCCWMNYHLITCFYLVWICYFCHLQLIQTYHCKAHRHDHQICEKITPMCIEHSGLIECYNSPWWFAFITFVFLFMFIRLVLFLLKYEPEH